MQREIVKRIAQAIATGHVHDHLGYEALAALKLTGPSYLDILYGIHLHLKPKLYVEIGCRRGDSLFLANQETRCIAIDPDPRLPELRENVTLSVTTSDKFFYHDARAESCRNFDLAFIDGEHSFQQAARDFANLERVAGPHSMIAIHDTIPMDEKTAQPPDPISKKPATSFHTGDVWRLASALVHDREDLCVVTIACPPTGLTLVGNFGFRDGVPGLGCGEFELANNCTFPHEWDDQVRYLNIVQNDPKVWTKALMGQRS